MKRVVAIVLLLVGIGLLVGAWSLHQRNQELIDTGRQVTATIVSSSQGTDSEGDVSYTPIYEYVVDGERYRKEGSVSSSSQPTIGDASLAWVDPDDPDTVLIDTFFERWFFVVLLGAFGIPVTIVGIGLALSARRTRRTAGQSPLAPPLPAPSTASASTRSGPDMHGPFVKGNRSSGNRGPFL